MGLMSDAKSGLRKGVNLRFLVGVFVAAAVLTFAASFYVNQGWPGASFVANNTPFASA